MVEIDFSYIYDFENNDPVWATFMQEFGARHGVKVNLKKMTWENAWAELFSYTSNDKGPHVSHVGNTWVNSLARMNALRAFKPDEIAAMGGAWDFMTPVWDASILPGDKSIWSIPWTGWIYVICYRKDLLQEAGIDPAKAFGTTRAVKETIARLVS